jgi:hypothetical protein
VRPHLHIACSSWLQLQLQFIFTCQERQVSSQCGPWIFYEVMSQRKLEVKAHLLSNSALQIIENNPQRVMQLKWGQGTCREALQRVHVCESGTAHWPPRFYPVFSVGPVLFHWIMLPFFLPGGWGNSWHINNVLRLLSKARCWEYVFKGTNLPRFSILNTFKWRKVMFFLLA